MVCQYKRNRKNGMSVVEALVALALLSLVLPAIVVLSAGSRSLVLDAYASSYALDLARASLDEQYNLAQNNFHLLAATTTFEGIYKKEIKVFDFSDYFSKKIEVGVSWQSEFGKNKEVKLASVFSDCGNTADNDTCNFDLAGDWQNPQIVKTIALADFTGLAGAYPISDLDVYGGRMYAAVSQTLEKTDPVLFVFDVANPAEPQLIGKADNAVAVKAGLAQIRAAKNSDGKTYIYAASRRAISASPDFGQLQIIDASNSSNDSWSPEIINYKISGVEGTSGQGIGNAIYLKNGYAYLGLTTGAGPEFHIVDIANPASPASVASATVGNGINAIAVDSDYIYLASPNAANVLVYESAPEKIGFDMLSVGSFSPGTSPNGKSLSVVGDKLYLGRTFGSDEFWILNASSSPSLAEFAPASHFDIGSGSQTSVNKIIIRGHLAFLATGRGKLEILDVLNPTTIKPAGEISLPGLESATALDCEGNYLYVASIDAGGNSYISVITTLP